MQPDFDVENMLKNFPDNLKANRNLWKAYENNIHLIDL